MKRRLGFVWIFLLVFILVSCADSGDIVIHTQEHSFQQTEESTSLSTVRENGITVLINKSSMVFHLMPDCVYASRMSEKNRLEIEVESVEYLLGHGYTPCARCSGEYKQNNSEE